MRNINSLRNTSQFKEVYQNGKSYANRLLVLYVVRTEEDSNKIGISVSKKVGNSVIRHRVKRLIRESYLSCRETLPKGCHMVVVARSNAAGAGYQEIYSSLQHLFRLHKLITQ